MSRLCFAGVMQIMRDAISAPYYPTYDALYGVVYQDYLSEKDVQLHRSALCNWHWGKAIPSAAMIGYYMVPGRELALATTLEDWIFRALRDHWGLTEQLLVLAESDYTLSPYQREWLLDRDPPSTSAECAETIARIIITSMARLPADTDADMVA